MRRLSKDTDYEVVPKNLDGTGGQVGRLLHECSECREKHVLDVDPTKLLMWLESPDVPHVQDFWPEVSAPLREEFFMSGICGKCWDRMFKEPEDETV